MKIMKSAIIYNSEEDNVGDRIRIPIGTAPISFGVTIGHYTRRPKRNEASIMLASLHCSP